MKGSKYIRNGVDDDASSSKSAASDSRASTDDDDDNGGMTITKYRDFSRVRPEQQSQDDDISAFIAQSATAKEPTFPVKLHMILSNPEYEDIISWLPHGRSWRILQQKAFEDRVIPAFFRHGRYSSFARQVNGWGFRRVTHGSDYNSYYHELFLRGMPHLCDKMKRLTTKDISDRKRSEKEEEERAPDFYALSKESPLPDCNGKVNNASNGTAHSSSDNKKKNATPAASASSLDNSNNKKSKLGDGVGLQVSSTSTSSASSAKQSEVRLAEMELAILEQRRDAILLRLKALAETKALQQQHRVVPASGSTSGTSITTTGAPFGFFGAGGGGSHSLGVGSGAGTLFGNETSQLMLQQHQRDLSALMALGDRGRMEFGANTSMMNATTAGVKAHDLPTLYGATGFQNHSSSLSQLRSTFFTTNPYGL